MENGISSGGEDVADGDDESAEPCGSLQTTTHFDELNTIMEDAIIQLPEMSASRD
jgi:hypothetical protein